MVRLMGHLETDLPHCCVKSYEQTFVGTHFVRQKTRVASVVSQRTVQTHCR